MSRNQPPRNRLPDVERKKIVDLGFASLWDAEGKEALEYLRERRGFSDTAILRYRLGYVPRWVKNEHDDPHELAGSIVIPLYDQYNELVALSSRNWRNKDKQFWHESFAKSNYLFGLNHAKEQILATGKAIVVEGEFDAIYLNNAGLSNVVALMGSSSGITHLALLSRYCNEIYYALDGDAAGRATAIKILELEQKYQINLHYRIMIINVSLPDKEDPDDYIKNRDRNAFVDLMKKSKVDALNELRL